MTKFGLGKGLGALIPQTEPPQDISGLESDVASVTTPEVPEPVSNGQVQDSAATLKSDGDYAEGQILLVNTEDILPNPFQPRKIFEPAQLQELASSIREHGIIQPLVVNQRNDGKYELVAGERRLEAAKLIGLKAVPVVVRAVPMADRQKLELAIIENVQRADLNLVEQARAYKRLHDEFGLTYEQIADQIGRSRPSVTNIVRLLQLPVELQRALMEGQLVEGHGRALLQVGDREKQHALYQMIVEKHLTTDQALALSREWTDRPHLRKSFSKDTETRMLENKLKSALNIKVNIKKSDNGGAVITITTLSGDDFRRVVEKLNS